MKLEDVFITLGSILMIVGLGTFVLNHERAIAPDHRTKQAADLACAQFGGVKDYVDAPKDRFRVLCRNLTYIDGSIVEFLINKESKWLITTKSQQTYW